MKKITRNRNVLIDEEIWTLTELANRNRLNFAQIFVSGAAGHNRNKVRKRLNNLIDRRLIDSENKTSWRKGQKLWFILTEKGRDYLIKRNMVDIQVFSLKLQKLIGELSIAQLRKWRHKGVLISEDSFKRGYLTPEEFQELLEHKATTFGPLWEVFKGIAKILVKVEGLWQAYDDLGNVTIGLKNGEPYLQVDRIEEPLGKR